jgi:hypothetical protein
MLPIAATVRWTLLFSSIFVASCTGPGVANNSPGQFGIVTSEGMVLANVEGSATGYTNTELTNLISRGVAESYVVKSEVPSKPATSGVRMFWHVINNGREPTAVVTVHLVRSGKIIRSAFTDAAAPDSNPDAVFMATVSQLAQRVLPLASGQIGPSGTAGS